MTKWRRLAAWLVTLWIVWLWIGCSEQKVDTKASTETTGEQSTQSRKNKKLTGTVTVFHAGSLAVPMRRLKKAFLKEHPDLRINLEAAGSRACARKITDLDRACDVMASADYKVIDNLLIPDHASWNIKFATNEMAIVYTEKSVGANTINKDNWYNVLLRDDVAFGRSNSELDPCGYRAVLTMKLAEKFYDKQGLTQSLLSKDTQFIRPKETDLLGLLESHTLDYLFLYRSVAQQHNLKYILLPDEINLKNTELKSQYESVSVELAGKTPGEKITRVGEPMVYGITIPNNAPNLDAAIEFVKFILSPDKGGMIMKNAGQPSAVPSSTRTYSEIPDDLKEFATP